MIPVDLNRLREAREFEMVDRAQVESDVASAVLAAREIWWCDRLGPLMKGRCDHHPTSGLGCGPARVVPVSGGEG